MLPLGVPDGLVQQVPADLSDVLHDLEGGGHTRTVAESVNSNAAEGHSVVGDGGKMVLTVQLYLTQSSQKREAENFFLMTTVMPCNIHCPTPTMFPEDTQTGAVGQTKRWSEHANTVEGAAFLRPPVCCMSSNTTNSHITAQCSQI